MIFVTVGAQEPFDRLIKELDLWAGDRKEEVFAQIAEAQYLPVNIRYEKFLDPHSFDELLHRSDLIVSHAGMGSIISALRLGKPILVFPRHAGLKETRNDHQIATARSFSRLKYVHAAFDANELRTKLNRREELVPLHRLGDHASEELTDYLRSVFVQ